METLIQSPHKTETTTALPPVTLKVLLENKFLLDMVANAMSEEADEIDLGVTYGKVNLEQLAFTVAYESGIALPRHSIGDVGKYLSFRSQGKSVDADAWLQSRSYWSIRTEKIKEGAAALPQIIPGAPHCVQRSISLDDYKDNSSHLEFAGLDTPKILSLLHRNVFDGSVSGLNLTEESLQDFKSLFRDRTIIDLGAGSGGHGLAMSDFLEAKNYIGVDPKNADDLLRASEDLVHNGVIKHLERIHVEYTDMLSFLRAMPSAVKDVTIFISGVDFYILHQVQDSTTNRRFDLTQKYVRDVAAEIDRVLGENGALVTHDSTIGLDVTREDNTGKYEESEIVFDKSKPGDRPDFPGFIYKKLPEPVR